jgi:phage-related protein
MSFYGYTFIFDGVPCEEYHVMLYDLGRQDTDGTVVTPGDIQEDRPPGRLTPLFYGQSQSQPLTFSMVFGADQFAIDRGLSLDRWDIADIAAWLSDRGTYRYLEIVQPDLSLVRYKCLITNLKYISVGWSPWAFSCDVVCDTAYARAQPQTFSYVSTGTLDTVLFSPSTYNRPYYPRLRIAMTGGDAFSLANQSDDQPPMTLTNLPSQNLVIDVDGENGVLTSPSGTNLYPFFNFKFFRLVRGDNSLSITGEAKVDIFCEFPVSVGG